MAFLLMLFEASTLLVLGTSIYFGWPAHFTSFWNDTIRALVVGFFGTLIALGIWHGANAKLRTNFGTITHIAVWPAAVANTIFLFFLWCFFHLILQFSSAWSGTLGFLGTAGAVIILFVLYPYWPLKLQVTMEKEHKIIHMSWWTPVFAGVYEAVILPIMGFLLGTFTFNLILSYVLTGLIMGLIGGIVGTLVVNMLSPHLKPWIELQ